ncbi:E3 ubiquitin ligase TRAF3IP2 isoform X1 [Syngnathus acus]|uniref:E3 ubiquitin ligase TRAF3IP2 isoform X1 n=1 Tax=Syngnathus acus TaxID=161584 RepID=UPI00188622D0|nr:E3 ubiquitin ligase TRAF3IP2 isoform X1 [Syngnathus acus]XP_037105746.1 E3 ubiquitin ligase TRAF3IP2 isoform X1 [Syngnathus acus]
MLPACKSPNSNSNTPQEDDETMSAEQREANAPKLDSAPLYNHSGASSRLGPQGLEQDRERNPDENSFSGLSSCSFPAAPFPSLADGSWPQQSSFSGDWSGYPSSGPPSGSDPTELCSCCSQSFRSGHKLSLEQPCSLRSESPSRHHTLPPYMCSLPGAACWARCPSDAPAGGPVKLPWHQNRAAYAPQQRDCRPPWERFTPTGGHSIPPAEKPLTQSMPLSLEQRRVFVTYEADDDAHVNEIINFVALLRHNGFDTHIDIFEQQFRSISKIDFMERYLSEKEYLIIIIISPKYHETVTASHVSPDNDERMCNTVYIHKQLQNEFIQNGSKNFRFIPILFPGAKKRHVPNWLLNTHVYGWPRDRDDILRRLMRVEKYNPPPIGELPTIVSIPI